MYHTDLHQNHADQPRFHVVHAIRGLVYHDDYDSWEVAEGGQLLKSYKTLQAALKRRRRLLSLLRAMRLLGPLDEIVVTDDAGRRLDQPDPVQTTAWEADEPHPAWSGRTAA